MFKTLFSLALVSTAAVTATPSLAAPFDGPYVGVTAGWNRDEMASRTVNNAPADAPVDQDSVLLGGYAGYNKTLGGRFLIGAELGFSGAIDDKVSALTQNRPLVIDPRYSFDVSARAGVLADAKTLVYVRGGYANTRVRASVTSAGGTFSQSENFDGWQVGGGIERAITDHVSARIEYRYSDFDANDGTYNRHQALVGISYNF